MGLAVLAAMATVSSGLAMSVPRPVFVVSSVLCFAWATLGRLGWAGQTWKGDSSVEQLDIAIFHILYWLGMYLATAAAI